jgi:hypothetical protein
MSQVQLPLAGYTRADVPLKILETSVSAASTTPLTGILEIFTDDGRLQLMISGDAAANLRIDLLQFLAAAEVRELEPAKARS